MTELYTINEETKIITVGNMPEQTMKEIITNLTSIDTKHFKEPISPPVNDK